jgi:hydrogenase assembly chaperone HypC/HupF
MCLDFPGLVVARDGETALVDTEGRQRRASVLLFPDLEVGEWVVVSTGLVVGRLDPAEAAQLRADVAKARGVSL